MKPTRVYTMSQLEATFGTYERRSRLRYLGVARWVGHVATIARAEYHPDYSTTDARALFCRELFDIAIETDRILKQCFLAGAFR